MASNSEQRIIRLEILNNKLLEALEKTLLRLDTLEQQQRSPGVDWGSGGGGGGGVLWCKAPGMAGASGSFPFQTPTGFTADVYRNVGGVQTLIASGATCYWWYADPCPAARLVPLGQNTDGSYDAIANSCTGV